MATQNSIGQSRRQQAFEKAKNKRRQAILSACEKLIRKTASTDFSMKDLAAEAGISTYTTYNLIGSKATVFYVLLNRGLDEIADEREQGSPSAEPLQCVLDAGRAGASVFASDPDFYRPLMRYLLGVPDPVNRPAYMGRAFDYWCNALRPLEDGAILRDGVSTQALARNLQVFFTGALDYWVHCELSGDELNAQIQYGIAIHLHALTRPEKQALLETVIAEKQPVIEAITLRDTSL